MTLILSQVGFALDAKPTLFQKNIKQCVGDKVPIFKIKNLEDLYAALDKAYPLRSNETIEREILYKEKGELRKLKVKGGVISLFHVLPDNTLELINNDARQKGLTEESAISQLLLRSDIQSDWLNVKETRSDLAVLKYARQQGRIKSLFFEIVKEKVLLECSNIELSDICSCRL